MAPYKFPYEMEYLLSYRITLEPPEVIGEVPEGLRLNFLFGGEFDGPKLSGKVRPGGGDWLLLRRDGVCILDVRCTLETNDSAMIYLAYRGVAEFGPDGYEAFLRGDPPPAEGIVLRTNPTMWTSHEAYLWVNRLFCVGIGKADLINSEVSYDVYHVR